MNIESVKMTTGGYNVVSEGNRFFLPNDDQDILAWLAQGNSPEPEFTDEELLFKAKDIKKQQIKNLRLHNLSRDLLGKKIDEVDFYVKTDPEINLFQSAILMPDNETRLWGCFSVAGKGLVPFSKNELLSIANHYEVRKNQEYNLCDLRRSAVDALTTIEEVEAFDITQVFV
jgi:hypothetical protein